MIEVGEHLTERINSARLKLELRRATRPAIVMMIGLAIGLAAWGIQVKEIGHYVIKSSREARFAVDDASAVLPTRDEVRFKGIPAGTITGVEMEHGQPVLTVKVYKQFGPIYRDARATLRPNTALEDMYLDILDRGTKAAGEARAEQPLPARQVDTSVQAEEVLQLFDPRTRTHLATLLRDLGGGLDRRGDDLRAAFVKVVPFLQNAVRVTDQLSERAARTRRLVRDFSILSGELAQRHRELRTLTGEGAATLRALAGSRPALDAMLRELPPTLGELDASFAAVRGVLPDVDRAMRSLGPVASRLPAGLEALRRLSDSADPAVRALREPVRRLVPLARVARPFASNLAQALAAMRPQTRDIDHITATTDACELAMYGFFHWDASLTKFEDARGGFPRGEAVVGLGSNPALQTSDLHPAKTCAPGSSKRAEP